MIGHLRVAVAAFFFAVMSVATVTTANSSSADLSVGAKRELVVRRAVDQVGKPYVFGGVGPTAFDCSGLVAYAYRIIGVRLVHWTGAQIHRGVRVLGRLRPADLLFFLGGDHVGLYIGRGMYVEAPHTGTDVRIRRLVRSALYEARRVIL